MHRTVLKYPKGFRIEWNVNKVLQHNIACEIMSANHSLEGCEVPTETVFRGNDDVLGQEQLTPPVPAQGKIFFNFTSVNIVT